MGIHYDKFGSNKILSLELLRKCTRLVERTGWQKWDRREEDTEEGGMGYGHSTKSRGPESVTLEGAPPVLFNRSLPGSSCFRPFICTHA